MTKKTATIKYKYALDLKEQIVDVGDLTAEADVRKNVFHCLSCGQLLIPVLGSVRVKHFRHAIEGICNPETYLHQLAKNVFYQVYSDCLSAGTPFNIEINKKTFCTSCQEVGIVCEVEKNLFVYDLIKLFPVISVETSDGPFVPDIMLSNVAGEKLYVEFVVTHSSSKEKMESGLRIIEIIITNEDDLEMIQKRYFSQTTPTMKFYNFKDISTISSDTLACNKKLAFFMLKIDGGAFVYNNTLQKYKVRLEQGDISFSKHLPLGGPQVYLAELEEAYHSKMNIRSCFLCRYHGDNRYREQNDVPIYCKFLKKNFTSTQAVSCEFYRADPSVFPSKTSLTTFINNHFFNW